MANSSASNMDQSRLDMLPSFGDSGRTLSASERLERCRRKGLCESCGLVKVTEPSNAAANLFRMTRKAKTITNLDVYEGLCIRCNRDKVPAAVASEWEFRSRQEARMVQQPPQSMMALNKNYQSCRNVVGNGSNSSFSNSSALSQQQHQQHRRQRVAPRRIQSERIEMVANSLSPSLSSAARRRPIGRTSSGSNSNHNNASLRQFGASHDTAYNSSNRRLDSSSASNLLSHPQRLPKTPERTIRTMVHVDGNGGVTADSPNHLATSSSGGAGAGGKSSMDRPLTILASFRKHSILAVLQSLQSLRHQLVYEGLSASSSSNNGNGTNNTAIDPRTCLPLLDEILAPGATMPAVQEAASRVLWVLAAATTTNNKNSGVVDASGFCPPDGTTIDKLIGPFCSCVDVPDATIPCLLQSIHSGTLEWGARCLLRHMGLLDEFSNANSRGFVLTVMGQTDMRSSALFWSGQFLLAALEHVEAPSSLADTKFLAFMLALLETNISTDLSSFDLLVTMMEVLTHVLESAKIDRLYQFDVIRCFHMAMTAINELSDQDERVAWVAGRLLAVLLTSAKSLDPGHCPNAPDLVQSFRVAMGRLSANPSFLAVMGHALWELTSRPHGVLVSDVREPLTLLASVTELHRGQNEHRDLSLALCAIVSNVCTLPGTCADDIPVFVLGDAITHHPSDPIVCEHAFRSLSRALCNFPILLDDVLRNLERPNIVVAFSVTPPTLDADIVAMVNSVQVTPLPDPMVNLLSQLIRRMGARLQYLRDEIKLRELYSLTSALAIGGRLKESSAQVASIIRKLDHIINDQQAIPGLRGDCCDVLSDLLIWSRATISISNILPGLQYLSGLRDSSIDLKIVSLLYAVASATEQSSQPSSSIFMLLVRILHKHNHVDAVFEREIFRLASGACSALSSHSTFQVDTCDIGSIAESAYKVLECDRDDSTTIANFLATLLVFCTDALDAVFESGTIVMVNDVMNDLPECIMIQEIGCAILTKVTEVDSMDMFLIILQTDGLKALVNALVNHGRRVPTVRQSASEALRRLSTLAALVPELRMLGLADVLVLLMKEDNQDDLLFCVDAFQILRNLDGAGEPFQKTPDTDVVNLCFDLLRSSSGSAEVFYNCLAYIKCINVEQLSTQSRNAWATLLFETLTTFIGVAHIASEALEVLGQLYGGMGNEGLPAVNFDSVRDAMLALMDSEHVIRPGLAVMKNLNETSHEAEIFTVLILVLYTFYDNEGLCDTALDLLQRRVTGATNHEWTGYEVDAVVGTLTAFAATSRPMQRSGTIILSHLCQHHPVLCTERSEPLVPILTLVEETFASAAAVTTTVGDDTDLRARAQIMLTQLTAR